jgi:glucosamine--fructose-6-phosphate aminotransferase (isomerizing)
MKMSDELRAAPGAVAGQDKVLAAPVADLVAHLNRRPPQVVVTCARGSSAHAATFGKHLVERALGIPVAAAAPSIASVYGRHLRLENQLFLAISQSGRSDDLVEQARSAKIAGALTAALVNEVESPLAAACDIVLPVGAGPERSIAATKSFVATLAALIRLVAAWAHDDGLAFALGRLPDRLFAAAEVDWSAACPLLAQAASVAVIGRGPTLGIAREAALKLKETCDLQAEAHSGAEFMHGPIALVTAGYPALLLMPTDAAAASLVELATALRRNGAAVLAAEPGEPRPDRLATIPPDHWATDAVCLIQSFYALAVRAGAARGRDVDRPRHLQKVTRTR